MSTVILVAAMVAMPVVIGMLYANKRGAHYQKYWDNIGQ
jgi:hypothetical protein